ncbi:hypothetical protein, partial [Heyndrickxia faecalis]
MILNQLRYLARMFLRQIRGSGPKVFYRLSKRQKGIRPELKMSPRSRQKDKKEWDPPPNVFLRRLKRQKGSGQWSKCPLEAFGTTEKVNLKIQNNYMYNKLKKNTPSIWYNKVILQTKTKLGV